MKVSPRLLLLILSILLASIGGTIDSSYIIYFSTISLLAFNVFYSLEDMKTRSSFLFFNISYFALLLGSNMVKILFGRKCFVDFTPQIEAKTQLLLYVALLCVFLGVFFYQHTRIKNVSIRFGSVRLSKNNEYNSQIAFFARKYIWILFVICYLCAGFVVLEGIRAKMIYGYLGLYTANYMKLPGIIYKFSSMLTFAFCLYMATIPTLKETKRICFLYIIYVVSTVFTGDRTAFVVGIILIITFLFHRNGDGEVYIGKKMILLGLLFGFFAIAFLGAYNFLRSEISTDKGIIDFFVAFFEDQGNSYKLLSYSMMYKNQLPDTNISYTFGPQIKLFRYGTIFSLFRSQNYASLNTKLNDAFYGNNLGSTISYFVLGSRYINGEGLGTQYIAELFVDFGTIGVVIFNLILGCMIISVSKYRKDSWLKYAYGMTIYSYLLFLPRDFAMSWFSFLISMLNIGVVLVILYLAKRDWRKLNKGY